MISVETISNKIQKLPPTSRKKVLDYVDSLLEKPVELTPDERIAAFKDLVKRHADNVAVVEDDSREAIYED